MFSGRGGQVLPVMQEGHSRLPGKEAEGVAQAMARIPAPFPPAWRRPVAFDNGTEFARRHQLHRPGIQTFFCQVRSPWEKGGVENRIGRLRRFLPRGTDLPACPDGEPARLVQADNNTPRKCLDCQTPAEIRSTQVLRLKCESTFPRKRE